MKNEIPWQKTLDAYLAENALSTDTRVLARALASDNSEVASRTTLHIEELERALHIEQHLDNIGLQPLPANLEKRLRHISKTKENNNIVRGKFTANWKKVSAIAATITAVVLFGNVNQHTPSSQQPTLAEIKRAEQEFAVALQYIAFAQAKSANKIQQTLDTNIRYPLNQGLLKPLNHFKESS
jgi:hypothetical protein